MKKSIIFLLGLFFILVQSSESTAQQLLVGSVSYHIEYYDGEGSLVDTTDMTIFCDTGKLAIRFENKGKHSTVVYTRGQKFYTICTNKGGSQMAFKQALIEEADKGALPLGWEKLIARSQKTGAKKVLKNATATEYQMESEMFSFNAWASDSLSYKIESFFVPGSSGATRSDKILMGAFGSKKFIMEGTLRNKETGDRAIIELKDLKGGKPDPKVFSTDAYFMLEMGR